MTARVLTKKGVRFSQRRASGGFDFPTSLVGTSTWTGSDGKPVTIYYDPATGQNGLQAAQFVASFIDQLMAYNDATFGVRGQGGNIIIAAVGGATDGSGGAYHYGCSFSQGGDWYEDVSPDARMVLGLVQAEVSESYMGLQSKGWNCILPDQEIQGRIIGGSKAWYSGQAVEVRTLSGACLSVTANHPVLTVEGFVPAGQLQKGQYLLHHIGEDEFTPERHDEQHAPSTAEQVFGTLKNIAGAVLSTEVASALDFHGDGAFFQGEIETVGSYSQLRGDGVSNTTQRFMQNNLTRSYTKHSPLSSGGSLHSESQRLRTPTHRNVSSIGLLTPRVRIHATPYQESRFGGAANLDTGIAEFAGDSSLADVVLANELLQRHAGQILTDEIVEVRNFHYDGPVYDFESPLGFIVANNLCISNCGGSGGEGLSRVLAEIVSGGPNGSLSPFASGPAWDGTDWISKDQGTDSDYPSIGCSVLYLWWMLKTYTMAQIVQAGEPDGTLASNYAALTGKPKTQAFSDFQAAVAAAGGPTSDNPFGTPTPPWQGVPPTPPPVPPTPPPVPPTPPPVPPTPPPVPPTAFPVYDITLSVSGVPGVTLTGKAVPEPPGADGVVLVNWALILQDLAAIRAARRSGNTAALEAAIAKLIQDLGL